MNTSIGYYIYIPDAYQEQPDKRFRTVYYLHGGRPGNEAREAFIAHYVHEVFKNSSIDPAIYVFVNGGELSHYNSDELSSYGEDVFIKELIPHIDHNYRTVAGRMGRGLEGFSQGGRAATRYMFKYPDLFRTVSAGGGSYTIERLIKESGDLKMILVTKVAISFMWAKAMMHGHWQSNINLLKLLRQN